MAALERRLDRPPVESTAADSTGRCNTLDAIVAEGVLQMKRRPPPPHDMRFQALYAMASISILVPTMFFACNVEREGLLPGKNSA
jgi:hypothetical protein